MADQLVTGHQGWFEEPDDDRDKIYVAPDNLVVAISVNLWTQYPQAKIPAYNQGKTNTCVANATAAALWYELKFSDQNLMQFDGPSRLFIYWNSRVSELAQDAQTLPTDNGSYTRRALRSLSKLGDCSEESWPFAKENIQVEPSNDAYTAAKDCTIDVYWRLDPARPVGTLNSSQKIDDGQETLLKVRQCLSEGYPVILGFKLYTPLIIWDKHQDGSWMLPDLWSKGTVKPHTKSPFPYGHCVLMIGYDDEKSVAICQNSWGNDRDGAPTFYMPYSWILDYEATSGFWTLRHNAGAGHRG